MSKVNVEFAGSASRTPSGARQTLREALRLFLAVADSFSKRRLLVAMLLVAAGALLAAGTPIALKLVVDSLAQGAVVSGVAFSAPLAFLLLYILGQYLTRALLELRIYMHGQAEQRIQRGIGRRVFEHLVRLPLSFHLQRKTGAMGETAEQGIRGYQLLLQHFVYTIVPVIIEFVAVALVLIHLNHAAYIAIFAVAAAAYGIAFTHGAKAIHEPSKTVSEAHIEAHGLLTDSLLNHETVKYFDAESLVCSRYDRALGHMETAWRRFYDRRLNNGIVVSTIFAGSIGASLYFATTDVLRGAMTLGDFVLVNAYVIRLAQPLELLGYAVRDVAQGIAFLQSMLDLFKEQAEEDCSRSPAQLSTSLSELSFENVYFSYRSERVVLKNISFQLPVGKMVAVVGVSGSGKSSLIRLLFRLFEPDSGRILLDGVPVRELSLSTLRQAIAVVPQDTVLFHDTIARNIGFGRNGASFSEIQEAARVANLHDTIMSMPDCYETLVGERGLKLSGGERQRVAIARAALKRPRIFVFDEATSSLDTRTEREILRNLLDVSARHTTLVIAHRLSTIVNADEILVLDGGSIAERGTHEELKGRNGAYADLWNAQQRGAARCDDAPLTSRTS